jgi:hypothetical protein
LLHETGDLDDHSGASRSAYGPAMLNAAKGNLASAQDPGDAAVKAKFDPLKSVDNRNIFGFA